MSQNQIGSSWQQHFSATHVLSNNCLQAFATSAVLHDMQLSVDNWLMSCKHCDFPEQQLHDRLLLCAAIMFYVRSMASVVACMLTMTRPAGSPIAPYKNFCRPGLLTAISCKFAPTVKAKNDPKPTYIPACHWVHSCLDIMKQCSVKVDDLP